MIGRVFGLLQALLACLILLVLHAVHGSTLLLTLFLHLATSFQSGSQRLSSSSLAQDQRSWQKKRPKNLGVVFVPAARGKFEWHRLRYIPWKEQVVLDGMLQDVAELVKWCRKLRLESLALYDERGILKRHAEQVKTMMYQQSDEVSVYSLSPSTIVSGDLRISLLSIENGKDHMATVAAGLANAVQSGFVKKEEVDVSFVQEKLYASSFPEPDLLIVLGGLHLRLRGFPPWHVRLSEIYHDSSLGLLGPPRLRYTAFKRAMDAYAGCEQRLGR